MPTQSRQQIGSTITPSNNSQMTAPSGNAYPSTNTQALPSSNNQAFPSSQPLLTDPQPTTSPTPKSVIRDAPPSDPNSPVVPSPQTMPVIVIPVENLPNQNSR